MDNKMLIIGIVAILLAIPGALVGLQQLGGNANGGEFEPGPIPTHQ